MSSIEAVRTRKRGAFGSIFVTAANVGVTFAITSLLARILGPDEFGKYSFVNVIILIVGIPFTSGLRTLLMREVAILLDREQWGELSGLLRGGFWAWLAYSLGLYLVISLARSITPVDWFGIPASLYAAAFILLPSVTAIAGLSAIMVGQQSVTMGQAANLLFRPVMFVVAIVVAWYAKFGPLDAHAAFRLHIFAALGAALLSLVAVLRLMPRPAFTASATYNMATWVRSIVPLTINATMGLIYTYTDIVMLGIMSDSESVGQYRVATQGALFIVIAAQALTPFVNPRIAMQFSRSETSALENFLFKFSVLPFLQGVAIFVMFLIAGRELLSLAFGAEYLAAWLPLVILSFGQLVNVATGFVGPILNMTGHERETMMGTILSAVINVVLNLALIPMFGANGAAIATCVSVAFWNIYLCWRAFRTTGLRASPLLQLGRVRPRRG